MFFIFCPIFFSPKLFSLSVSLDYPAFLLLSFFSPNCHFPTLSFSLVPCFFFFYFLLSSSLNCQQQVPKSSSMADDIAFLGLKTSIHGILIYIITIIWAIVTLLVEKDNKYLRFHAFQELMYMVPLWIIYIIIQIIQTSVYTAAALNNGSFGFAYALYYIDLIIIIGFWILNIVMAIKAYQGAATGERFKLPLVGDMADARAQ